MMKPPMMGMGMGEEEEMNPFQAMLAKKKAAKAGKKPVKAAKKGKKVVKKAKKGAKNGKK